MRNLPLLKLAAAVSAAALFVMPAFAQVGHTWPSEKKLVIDPVTGTELTFLTSSQSRRLQDLPDAPGLDLGWPMGDLPFQSGAGPVLCRQRGDGHIVQVTDKGYMGMLCVARKSMKLYLMRDEKAPADVGRDPYIDAAGSRDGRRKKRRARPHAAAPAARPGVLRFRGPLQVMEVDLGSLFADAVAGTLKGNSAYERVCGVTPPGMHATGNMGLDADEDYVYFGITRTRTRLSRFGSRHEISKPVGPRGMGAGPSGLASMNLKTGEVKTITVVPFQIGHVQTNPWVHGEIVFCWETGGKAPQRTWTVMADGTGLRPLFPEASYEWVTHEAVITHDEVAIAILICMPPGRHGWRRTRPGARATGSGEPTWAARR